MSRRSVLVAALPLAALLVILYLANVSVPGDLRGCPVGCASTSPSTSGALRVLDLNVLHDFPGFTRLEDRLDLIARVIERREADLVLLEEVPWTIGLGSTADRLARETGLNHLALRANGNRWTIGFEEGVVILSRFPLTDAAWVELKPRAGPFEHRVALAATAESPAGPLRVVVTHLAGSADANAAQAAALVDWTGSQAGPILIGGDFNAGPDSATYAELPWTDLYRSIHPDDPGLTCCDGDLESGAPASLDARVDYLFADGLTATSMEVILTDPLETPAGRLRLSDHAGLFAELQPTRPH